MLLLYGIIIILVAVGCCTATLAELASVYPTAGGQIPLDVDLESNESKSCPGKTTTMHWH